MFGAIRTAISIAFIACLTWFAFSVDLGPRTLAEHVDRISDTQEAQELMEGARERVNPALEEAKQRVLGEHVEAPTYIDGQLAAAGSDAARPPHRLTGKTGAKAAGLQGQDRSERANTQTGRASDAASTRLPGRH